LIRRDNFWNDANGACNSPVATCAASIFRDRKFAASGFELGQVFVAIKVELDLVSASENFGCGGHLAMPAAAPTNAPALFSLRLGKMFRAPRGSVATQRCGLRRFGCDSCVDREQPFCQAGRADENDGIVPMTNNGSADFQVAL